MSKELIGVSDAAKIAGVSRQTIQTWIKTGRLTVIQRGRPEGYTGQPKALVDPDQVLAIARERGTLNGGTQMQSV